MIEFNCHNFERMSKAQQEAVCTMVKLVFDHFSKPKETRTRRGRVRSKPLLGGATPPGKGAGLKGKPAVGRRKESEVCPVCGNSGIIGYVRKGVISWDKCLACGGQTKRIAPPNPSRQTSAARQDV